MRAARCKLRACKHQYHRYCGRRPTPAASRLAANPKPARRFQWRGQQASLWVASAGCWLVWREAPLSARLAGLLCLAALKSGAGWAAFFMRELASYVTPCRRGLGLAGARASRPASGPDAAARANSGAVSRLELAHFRRCRLIGRLEPFRFCSGGCPICLAALGIRLRFARAESGG